MWNLCIMDVKDSEISNGRLSVPQLSARQGRTSRRRVSLANSEDLPRLQISDVSVSTAGIPGEPGHRYTSNHLSVPHDKAHLSIHDTSRRSSCSSYDTSRTLSSLDWSRSDRRASTSSSVMTRFLNRPVDVCSLGPRLEYDARFESMYRPIGSSGDDRRHIWMVHADLQCQQHRQLRGIQRDIHLFDSDRRRQLLSITQRRNRLERERQTLATETEKRHSLLTSLHQSHNRRLSSYSALNI